MLCDVCKTESASVFLTQIVDGKMQKVNMCENCSRERGVTDPTAFALADLLKGLGAAQEVEQIVGRGQKCDTCGFTLVEFKKTGRLGCSACYPVFSEGIATMLSGMHKGSNHVGKVPERFVKTVERERVLKDLQQRLRKAVTEENYEEAATLRDQIKGMGEEE
ncbi:MAG: UvrB/UvrC motif-containing protein [Verrucomicrobiota bacterium]